MESTTNSLMVVLGREEYCFLYDKPSFPELLESLLEFDSIEENEPTGLTGDQAREIARGLIGRTYQEI